MKNYAVAANGDGVKNYEIPFILRNYYLILVHQRKTQNRIFNYITPKSYILRKSPPNLGIYEFTL